MKIVNIDGEHLHIFPGKMWPMRISKVTKKQAFTLSLEDTFFEKPQGGPFPQPFKGQRLFTATHESFRVVSFIMTPRNVQRWINICQEFKTNCDRNVAEEPSLHTAELLFSGRCCFFSQIVNYPWHNCNGSCSGVVWKFTTDLYGLTDRFILSITRWIYWP